MDHFKIGEIAICDPARMEPRFTMPPVRVIITGPLETDPCGEMDPFIFPSICGLGHRIGGHPKTSACDWMPIEYLFKLDPPTSELPAIVQDIFAGKPVEIPVVEVKRKRDREPVKAAPLARSAVRGLPAV